MRLYVYVLEAKDLKFSDSYAKIQVGKFKAKTRIVKNTVNPVWNEEFVFMVNDMDEEVCVSVYHCVDGSGLFLGSRELMGRVEIPISSVVNEDNQTLPPSWFSLRRTSRARKHVHEDQGRILLTISLHGKYSESFSARLLSPHSGIDSGVVNSPKGTSHKGYDGKKLIKNVTNRLEKLFSKNDRASKTEEFSKLDGTSSDSEDSIEDNALNFEDAMEMLQSRDSEQEMPGNLEGGILLDQTYAVRPCDLNAFLFAPDCQFMKDLANLQGTTNIVEGPWIWKIGDQSQLKRVVSYTKAATKLVKAVKATEYQTFVKANGKEFAVLVDVSTPDAPYGSTFKVQLLYKIMPGSQQASTEESARLIISWGINFHQSTIMKGMIEGGARQGLKESFEQFASLLAQNFNALDNIEMLDKDQILAALETEQPSDLELAINYFCNFTVVSTVFMVMYVIIHIFLCKPRDPQGLEFHGLRLPDSFGELVTCGIIVLQLERVFDMVSHFVQARLQRGGDHGVRAHGDGWVLTVALIEGTNIASLDPTELSDPYVVFTCNGKMKTSSVQLQTHEPQWNEILEFDAKEEPPSVLDVEVFDFEGPFDQPTSLGHAEINLLKHTTTELADMWVFLEGKLAQSSQSKLHLRIFLDNSNGVETIKEYLTKVEKEVGKKLNLRSPQRNHAFQKLFELPAEEFLIKDYACSLRRKFPLQGRLFLSARIVGFYANFFGHKTRFFFLWEDIEDIQELPPSFASIGSPLLVIILHKDRGLDARYGAKLQDQEGRLRFYFQSFVSFQSAYRTIYALWRSRTLPPEQKEQIAKGQMDAEPPIAEGPGSILDTEDIKMSQIYTAELPICMNSFMELFDGGKLEYETMTKSGCLNYATTAWESVKPGVLERSLSYKFSRHVSFFGVEVNCNQQKVLNDDGWTLKEVMALQNIPFDDHFRVHFKYEIVKSVLAQNSCKCDVYIGIFWLKSTKFQERIARNVIHKFSHRLREIFELVEREFVLAKDCISP